MSTDTKKRVILVGAGPGDPGLLTVKGKEALCSADCIIYDRLASPKLLSLAKEGCELIYVGKENHHHVCPQDKINALLVEKAKQYDVVVRLKGGDVYVFGRGGEEALFLREHGIDFEVIPGVRKGFLRDVMVFLQGLPLPEYRLHIVELQWDFMYLLHMEKKTDFQALIFQSLRMRLKPASS